MPRGFGGVREHSSNLENRRGGGGGSNALWFRLKSGEEAIVRFLEQDDDIAWCHSHEVPVANRSFGRDVPCCDQERDGSPCPGCDRELPRRFKGYINVIWQNAPVFKRDKDGKVVKDRLGDTVVERREDQVALWSSGIRLFEELDEINTNYKGLGSRLFRIKRKGEGLDTKYVIVPADPDGGPSLMSEAEQKLAESKNDLGQYVKAPTPEEFLKELGEGGGSTQSGPAPETARVNPFMRGR